MHAAPAAAALHPFARVCMYGIGVLVGVSAPIHFPRFNGRGWVIWVFTAFTAGAAADVSGTATAADWGVPAQKIIVGVLTFRT